MEYNSIKIKNYLQEGKFMQEENWNEQAKGILKAHLARKNIKCDLIYIKILLP